jgi:hypothetical protein
MTIPDEIGDCRQIYHHTVPVFNYDRAEPQLQGSGVFISVDTAFFVTTAAHVLEPGFQKVGFGFLGTNSVQVFGAGNMPILKAQAQAETSHPRELSYKDGLDLAIIEPTAEVLESLQSHYRAFDLRGSAYRPDAPWGVVSGWPARKNVYNRRKRVCDFDTCYHIQCPIVPEAEMRRARWNPELYIGLSADKAKDFASAVSRNRIQLPHLEGMSGGGFWVKSQLTGEWSLAGIVVEDHPSKRMLKVIRVEHLWAPLSGGWGLQR